MPCVRFLAGRQLPRSILPVRDFGSFCHESSSHGAMHASSRLRRSPYSHAMLLCRSTSIGIVGDLSMGHLALKRSSCRLIVRCLCLLVSLRRFWPRLTRMGSSILTMVSYLAVRFDWSPDPLLESLER